ncbi:cell wall-binding repeat-containing protein [Herbiconiux sp. P15]|uniref:cell wall-binding repeat-containing protein n=1 Tax=Herbiconiux liukaitaii TaxID=3342799 RepID=UPI0035B72E80
MIRPRALLVAVLAAVLAVGGLTVGGPAPAALAAAEEDRVHDLVNYHRIASSLPSLVRDATIDAAAEEWANHMGTLANPLTHSTREWRASRMPPGWTANGENIAYGYGTADAVMEAWMNSPGHRSNILGGAFTRIGIGYAMTPNGTMWVQIFGGYASNPQPPVSAPSSPPSISGTPGVGQALTASPGTWAAGVSVSYQWSVANTPVPGATAPVFYPDQSMVGRSITVSVTGSRPGYTPVSVSPPPSPQVTTPFTVDRISGPDRYAVAVSIARRAYPATAPVVYVATGTNYPDALSAGPAAALQGGPLLLTRPDVVPAEVEQAIAALAPQRIVIVGGPASVSPAVESRLAALAPTVVRLSGADRFEASRAIVQYAFGEPKAAIAYVATGLNFPDALAAGAAGGSSGSPVLLVNGSTTGVDAASIATLQGLGVSAVKIAGGPNSVSPGVEAGLATIGSVQRLSGADRYEAATSINLDAYGGATTAYLATGTNFPDALAGSALAGIQDAPLFVVPTECVPRKVLGALTSLGVSNVVLLGGPASLAAPVQNLSACWF